MWDDDPNKSKKQTPNQKKPQRPITTTDIVAWLELNAPGSAACLKDLRLALYQRRDQGNYAIEEYGGYGDRFVVVGPCSSLLIVSEKARHFLLRSLCRLRRRYRFQGF
jgi:hypothetical protein